MLLEGVRWLLLIAAAVCILTMKGLLLMIPVGLLLVYGLLGVAVCRRSGAAEMRRARKADAEELT